RGAAWHDADKHIDGTGKFYQRREIVVRDTLRRATAVISDRKPECFDPSGDAAADPPHSIDADGAIAQGQPTMRVLRCFPLTIADESCRLRDFAHNADKQPQSEIGDLLIQDIRSVGDDDIPAPCIGSIHRIVSNAVAGDDLQVGKGVDELPVDGGVTGHATNRSPHLWSQVGFKVTIRDLDEIKIRSKHVPCMLVHPAWY